jgi:hypothetical protein
MELTIVNNGAASYNASLRWWNLSVFELLCRESVRNSDDFACEQYSGNWAEADMATSMPHWRSRGGLLMKFAATHKPPRDVSGLQRGALCG